MKQRLAFMVVWGLLMLSAQIPLLFIYSVVGFESVTIAMSETIAAIFCAIIASMMMIQEDYDGEEIRNKK